jgi:hypothetical protein
MDPPTIFCGTLVGKHCSQEVQQILLNKMLDGTLHHKEKYLFLELIKLHFPTVQHVARVLTSGSYHFVV